MKWSSLPVRKASRGRKPWILDCRSVGGRREFFATRGEAETARESKLLEVKNHGSSALSLTHEERVDFVRARDRLAAAGADIKQATEFYLEHHAKVERVTFGDAIARAVEVKQATNKDPEYVRKFEAHLKSLQATCAKELLSEVTRQDIEQWLFGNQWSPATIRNKRIDVRTFFRFAEKRRWLVLNPAAALEAVELADTPPGILKVDECESLLRGADRKWISYLVLNLFCGIRPEETVQLRPEHIHLDRGFVEVPAPVAKSRKRRIVELSDNARRWLKKAEIEGGRSIKWYARQLPKIRACAAAVLAKERGSAVTATKFPWPKNCLRHSFGSYHLAMHGSAEKTALQMGHHSTEMLFRHYRELVTKDEAKRFWQISP